MKQTELIMGMPITVEIIDENAASYINNTFTYFKQVDEQFSTYKPTSEISRINNGLPKDQWSKEMKDVFSLCDQTRQQTNGYFDIFHDNTYDPSGLVKGWAINNAANSLKHRGVNDFYIEAGGDIQVAGKNENNEPWKIGIRSPFNIDEIIKIIEVRTEGVATSGTYIRGQHIYDPINSSEENPVKSLTVIGPNIYEADRFATAAFAMGKEGIAFIDSLFGFEGYMVDQEQIATYTRGFENYVPIA